MVSITTALCWRREREMKAYQIPNSTDLPGHQRLDADAERLCNSAQQTDQNIALVTLYLRQVTLRDPGAF